MEKTFYLNGIKYISWTNNEVEYSAVAEQVKILGKEVFEQEFFNICEETDSVPDAITYLDFDNLIEEIHKASESFTSWLREQEIM